MMHGWRGPDLNITLRAWRGLPTPKSEQDDSLVEKMVDDEVIWSEHHLSFCRGWLVYDYTLPFKDPLHSFSCSLVHFACKVMLGSGGPSKHAK